uniref:Lipase domain-containing protein n=1 Tax=Mola mola TaxID=94237 RepID=A0A3Q3X8A8_MOLML
TLFMPPWGGTAQRPASLLPDAPEEIGTRFLLFTPKNQINNITDQTTHVSNYSGMRKTRFIIPGYLEEGDEDWPQEMCKVRTSSLPFSLT